MEEPENKEKISPYDKRKPANCNKKSRQIAGLYYFLRLAQLK